MKPRTRRPPDVSCPCMTRGRGNIIETAFRVTRRYAEDASTPAYQASMTVLKSPNARSAIMMEMMVRPVRSLCRKAFLKSILRMCIGQDPFIEVPYDMGLFCSPRVMGDHYDRFSRFRVEPVHEVHYLFRGYPVEIARRFVGNQYGRVGHNRPGLSRPFAPARRIAVPDSGPSCPASPTTLSAISTCSLRSARESDVRMSGSSTFSKAVRYRDQVIELEDEADIERPPACAVPSR